jgi:hypothetical protein
VRAFVQVEVILVMVGAGPYVVLIRIAGANMMLIGLCGAIRSLCDERACVNNVFAGVLELGIGGVLVFFPRSRLPDSASLQRMHDWLKRR